jgi:hypothetical protein
MDCSEAADGSGLFLADIWHEPEAAFGVISGEGRRPYYSNVDLPQRR